ncbi:MAG: YlcI/YnfO family protein, partial [Deefgea sp.]
MKTATIPSLRVNPELRSAAESVLLKGESLSSFIETSLRTQIASRQIQQAFIERGLASAEESRRSGEYFSADSVLGDMDALLAKA